LLIGDAGNFADILTGEGIYFALKSGECAAEAIHRGFNMGGAFAQIGEIYERLWRKAFNSKEYLFHNLLQRLVVNELFLNFNIRRAIKKPNMAQILASILCHQKSKIRLLF
jgi:flavin-dependent dehydrogenase